MALLVTRQVTLTEKNDSGPFYNVFYSPDCETYYASPNGQGVYLPSVGSSVLVSVASTTSCIKLVSTGQCVNELESGSGASTTTSTTSTTTCTPGRYEFELGYHPSNAQSACNLSSIVTAWGDRSVWNNGSITYYANCYNNTKAAAGYYSLVGQTEAQQVIQVNSLGKIIQFSLCGATTTTTSTSTTTTTTTAAPIYGPYYSGQNVIDGGTNYTTACSSTASWPFYADEPFDDIGFGTTIYTDSAGQNIWVGNGSYYGISSTSFTSATKAMVVQSAGFVSGIVQCGLTQVWSDTQPGYGNLSSCGCTGEVGVYNYAILGTYNIYQDLTGRTIYQDSVGDDLFIGYDLWYCITNAEDTETTISIQINNFGVITDWVDCSTTTTTTTTSTTSTTTAAVGCYEYLVECRTIGGCFVSYTDCNGDSQGFTQQYDTGGVICARPTPNITGGTVEFLGDCGLTTTSTTSTTSTTTATPLRTWYGSNVDDNSDNSCSFGPQDYPNEYKHNGSIAYPRIGDTVYYSNGSPFDEEGWYWIVTDDKTIQVNSSGVVIDLVDCTGLL